MHFGYEAIRDAYLRSLSRRCKVFRGSEVSASGHRRRALLSGRGARARSADAVAVHRAKYRDAAVEVWPLLRRARGSAHRICAQGGREVVQGRELAGDAGPTTTARQGGRQEGGGLLEKEDFGSVTYLLCRTQILEWVADLGINCWR